MSGDEGLIARIGVTRSETFTLDIELEIEPATTVAARERSCTKRA